MVRGQSVISERITDEVGNQLLAGEAIIFVGNPLDFGDAADPRTPVSVDDNGPRHVITEGFQLGDRITADAGGVDNGSGTADSNADGDDGVAILGAMRPGFSTQFVIDVQSPTVGGVTPAFYLDAWFDWNGDGTFDETEVERFGSIGSGVARVIGTKLDSVCPTNRDSGPAAWLNRVRSRTTRSRSTTTRTRTHR